MSGRIYGLAPGEYLPGPDFKLSETESGGAVGSQSFRMLKESWRTLRANGTFADGVTASSLDTNTVGRGGDAVTVDRYDLGDTPDGYLLVKANYAGWSADYDEDKEEKPRYSKRGVLVQRSIMTHPEIVALSDDDKFVLNQTLSGNYFWDVSTSTLRYKFLDSNGDEVYVDTPIQPTAGVAVEFAKVISLDGTRTFEEAHVTWEKTWSGSSGVPSTTEANLGKLDEPDGIDTPAGLGWRLDEVSESRMGTLYRNRTTHTLGEWDGLIYDY